MCKCWWILMLLAGVSANAASFDCAKATTPQEKAICASPELSKADEQMAAAYHAVLAAVPADMAPEIRAGQRQWLSELNRGCQPGYPAPYASFFACLSTAYASRIKELQHMMLREGGITFVWHSVSLTAPAPPPPPGVSIGDGEDHSGYLNASWPEASEGTPEWQAWNKAIEAATARMAALDRSSVTDFKEIVSPDMDVDVTTSLGIVGRELVTATIDNQWYGHGAAHPNENSLQFNWLLREQRELKPEDVFVANSGWKAYLYDRSMKSLVGQFGPGYPADEWAPGYLEKQLREIVSSPGNWQIDGSGLTIIFQTYAVACRVCDPNPVSISWADLKPYRNPSFEIPR